MARDLDTLIREARQAEDPSDAERALVRRGLEQRLARGASDAGPLARGTSSGVSSGVVVAGALALLALAAGVGVLATRSSSVPVMPRPAAALAAPDIVTAPRGASPPSHVAAPERPVGSEARAGASEAHAVASEARAVASEVGAVGSEARVGASEVRPVASHERPVRVVVTTPEVAPSAPVRGTARPVAPRTPDASLAAESRALGDVQRALRDGAGERALQLLDEQDRRFARGALSEERAAARVLGLCAAGRVAAAREGAASFGARHPSSPLRARVLAACAEPSAGAAAPAAVGRP